MNWGGYSIVVATRLLADQAIADGTTRLTLLSGVSYPIVSDERLIEFAQSDLEYVDANVVNLPTETKPFVRRFTSRHFSFHLKQNLYGRIIRRLSREFWARMPRIDPVTDLAPLKLTVGSQWWSVKSETYMKAMRLLGSNPKIEKYFQKIECADESFFGTVFHQVSPSHLQHGTTFVKWIYRGQPQIIGLTELLEARALVCFPFIRKITAANHKDLYPHLG